VPDRTYTAEQVDAAVARLGNAERVDHAREIVVHAAPGLQHILAEALHHDQYFEEAHDQHVRSVAAVPDDQERLRQLRTLVAEEVRLGMLVGVAVGFQLAHELQDEDLTARDAPTPPDEESI
jgi:hypothetical protein